MFSVVVLVGKALARIIAKKAETQIEAAILIVGESVGGDLVGKLGDKCKGFYGWSYRMIFTDPGGMEY